MTILRLQSAHVKFVQYVIEFELQYETITAIRMPMTEMRRFRPFASFLSAMIPLAIVAQAAPLVPVAQIKALEISECSGIAKSRQFDDLYWTHNDSGGSAAIYAITAKGNLVASIDTRLPNIDWEDIATDNRGNLYLADTGNFDNTRRDLVIHKIIEPSPSSNNRQLSAESFYFVYPEQSAFPPAKRLYDCEALFWANDTLFLLTKSLGDTATSLYRFDTLEADAVNRPFLLDAFDIGPRVTAADASPDGSQLAILTTRSVWVFQKPNDSGRYFDGHARVRTIQAGQCEAICWQDDNTLLIANEARQLFQVPLSTLVEY